MAHDSRFSAFCLLCSLLIGSALFLDLTICEIGFLAGISISALDGWLALAGAAAVAIYPWFPLLNWRSRVLAAAVVALILGSSVMAAGQVWDLSIDGQVYQGTSVASLAEGWNPILNSRNRAVTLSDPRVVNFPKAYWIQEATIVRMTGNLESGKALTAIQIANVFFLVCALLLSTTPISLPAALCLAGLAALNPIAVNQSLTYYVDGQVACALTSFVACGLLAVTRGGRVVLLLLGIAAIQASNLKFTSLVLAAIFAIVLVAASLWLCKRAVTIRVAATLTAGFSLGTFVLGYNPYVLNFLQHGHPFYPLSNFGSADYKSFDLHQTPRNFQGLSNAESLAFSMLAQSGSQFEPDTWTWSPAVWKIPFTTSREELSHFVWCDLRVGGWGPMFGGCMLLSIAGLAVAVKRGRRSPQFVAVMLLNGTVFVTALLMPSSWCARYAPYPWLIPLSTATFLLIQPGRAERVLASALMLFLALDVALIASVYFPVSAARSARLRAEYARIAVLPRPMEISFGELRLNAERLAWAGIPYSEVPEHAGGFPLEGNEPHVVTFVYSAGMR